LRKRNPDRGVIAWFRAADPDRLFMSSVTIGELEHGIARRRPVDPDFAADLERWLDATVRIYGDRILSLDVHVARRWGQLAARIGNKGMDLAIAATALEHGLTVVTRNVTDFVPTGVPVVNPFRPEPKRRS
jgi:predicted nucleic acid-binding protein